MTRGGNQSENAADVPVAGSDAEPELIIDAQAEPLEQPSPSPNVSPVRRDRVLPQASSVRALSGRRESEIAARTVAVATAGGVVAGAASVMLIKAARQMSKRSSPGLARRRAKDIVASRSFMVDVHLLRSQR